MTWLAPLLKVSKTAIEASAGLCSFLELSVLIQAVSKIHFLAAEWLRALASYYLWLVVTLIC